MATTRRLTAILAADVAGYSRLMGADEEGTHERLKAHLAEVVDPKITEHRGRVVKNTGDGFLAEFASVVDAVRCAVEMQRGMAERNAGIAAPERIEFRVGINLGDVIVERDDIFGDGVNVAARLEGLAAPGGICVSGTVRDHIGDRVPYAFEDLGERPVKNIARPVRVYRIRDQGIPVEKAAAAASPPPPLPDKPSIAVLPFQNMSGDPEQDYFADGMVEEITTAISRLPWLFVIARNSSFTYKGRAVDVKQVARELGVRYVLEGSVRKAQNRVRITGQLIDTASGAHIWADRFDGALDDIFELQDQVASNVAGAIEPRLRQFEIERANRKPTESLVAYDLYLQALARLHRYNEESIAEAIASLKRALAMDPFYAPVAAMLGYCRAIQLTHGWSALSEDEIADSVRLARWALESLRNDPDTLIWASWTLLRLAGEAALAATLFDRAVALNPNSAFAWVSKGWFLAVRNLPEAAIEALERALTLNPFDPLGFFASTGLAYAHLAAHRFEQAIEWADRASQDAPRYLHPMLVKLAANVHLGRLAEAHTDLARLRAAHPGLTVAGWRARAIRWAAPEIANLIVAGLRKVGMPEE
jgi:TolB-like protein/class 3 adenylate cyclase/Tfp pilus assembly protein PilF